MRPIATDRVVADHGAVFRQRGHAFHAHVDHGRTRQPGERAARVRGLHAGRIILPRRIGGPEHDLAVVALHRVDVEPFAGDDILHEERLGERLISGNQLRVEGLQCLDEASLPVYEQRVGFDGLERGQEGERQCLADGDGANTARHPPGDAARPAKRLVAVIRPAPRFSKIGVERFPRFLLHLFRSR